MKFPVCWPWNFEILTIKPVRLCVDPVLGEFEIFHYYSVPVFGPSIGGLGFCCGLGVTTNVTTTVLRYSFGV